jgi:hypothetical protein
LLHHVENDDDDIVVAGETRKPDVEMFLPILRVLGKGSFGKVKIYYMDIYSKITKVASRFCPFLTPLFTLLTLYIENIYMTNTACIEIGCVSTKT